MAGTELQVSQGGVSCVFLVKVGTTSGNAAAETTVRPPAGSHAFPASFCALLLPLSILQCLADHRAGVPSVQGLCCSSCFPFLSALGTQEAGVALPALLTAAGNC